jgi:hypothetical protein
VVLTRAEASEGDDPVLGQFLGFLAATSPAIPSGCRPWMPASSNASRRWSAASKSISMPPCRKTMNERRASLRRLVIHGWTVFAHPLFLAQIEALARQVETLKQKDPVGYVKKNASKRLAAITKLAFDVIPQDPTRPEYRQGGTLGDDHKHWFRAKFFQQYRLFFRYHARAR